MLPDLNLLIPIMGPVFVVLSVVAAFGPYRNRYPTQYGRANARARRRLRSVVRSWPAEQRDAIVRWRDHASATRLDVRDALHEAGWFVRDEDPDGDGWPFHATRDPARAASTDPPPTRGALLVGRLRAAAERGDEPAVVDHLELQPLGGRVVMDIARHEGWRSTSGAARQAQHSRAYLFTRTPELVTVPARRPGSRNRLLIVTTIGGVAAAVLLLVGPGQVAPAVASAAVGPLAWLLRRNWRRGRPRRAERRRKAFEAAYPSENQVAAAVSDRPRTG